jgi:hypothetical protein
METLMFDEKDFRDFQKIFQKKKNVLYKNGIACSSRIN